jgi:hypothetical protein
VARSKIPHPLERRHLLTRELPEGRARAIAAAYAAEGREVEAAEFMAKAGDRTELEALREQAIAAGDGFLFRMAAQLLDVEPQREEWSRLADAAAAAGKLRYETEARRQAARGKD